MRLARHRVLDRLDLRFSDAGDTDCPDAGLAVGLDVIGAETVPSLWGATAAKISKTAPPCWPLTSASMADRCPAVAFSSMT